MCVCVRARQLGGGVGGWGGMELRVGSNLMIHFLCILLLLIWWGLGGMELRVGSNLMIHFLCILLLLIW